MDKYHIPVMPEETIKYLSISPGSWYIDCTLGGGGHTEEIVKLGGKVLALDMDSDAINEVSRRYNLTIQESNHHLQSVSDNLILYQTNFASLTETVQYFRIKPIKGVLFDLGVSTHQLETAPRGFSFNIDAPLDMRMDPNSAVTAADLINALHEKELADLFWVFGEERFSRPIAKKVVQARSKKKITTTNELAQIILSVRPRSKNDRTHPATRVFQALRIAVNNELENLKIALPQAVQVLKPGGKLVVISFHSLEDRIVKKYFINEQKNGSIKIITQKPVTPTDKEVEKNPRARSGKLRAAEKI